MPRPAPTLLLGVTVLLCAASTAAAATFPDGVAAGDATATTARLWTRAERPGDLSVRVAGTTSLVSSRTVTALAANDNAVTVTLRGLEADRRYYFRFYQGSDRSALGQFRTAPRPSSERPVRFAVAAGFDPAYDANLTVAERIAAHHNDFNVLLGDTVLSGDARTLPAKRAAYRRVLAVPSLRDLRGDAGLYATWGAGEFAPEFAPSDPAARSLYRIGARAFQEATPVVARSSTGLYRTIRWGRAAELFVLDERSFRGALAGGAACVNPQTGALDPAPTLPQDARNSYEGFYQQLGAPVTQLCIDTIRSPKRTMLGRAQLVAFRRDIRRSTARFKIVLSEEPLSQFYFLPYDRWEGYEAERQKVLSFLRDEVSDVLVLSAGASGGVTGDVRLHTLEPPGVVGGGFVDIGVPSAGAPTFADALEQGVGGGTADPTSRLFLRRAPPFGAGMRCAATNAHGYAQVEVARGALTVTLRGEDDKPLRDANGGPCGPFRFEADSYTGKPR